VFALSKGVCRALFSLPASYLGLRHHGQDEPNVCGGPQGEDPFDFLLLLTLPTQSEESANQKTKNLSEKLWEPVLALVGTFEGGNLDGLVKHVCEQLRERFFVGETVDVTQGDKPGYVCERADRILTAQDVQSRGAPASTG
jgi:hypothetical protein